MQRNRLRALSRRAFLGRASAASLALPLAAGFGPAAGRTADQTTTRGLQRGGETDAAPAPALDVLLAAFERFPVVALGEAHSLQEEHDFLTSLLQHPELPTRVTDIVVEFGNAHYQDVIDRYVLGGDVIDPQELRLVWRNSTQSPGQTWDAPMYPQFFAIVRAVNQTLPAARRLRVWLGDPPVDWQAVTSRADLEPFLLNRGAHFSSVVEREVLAKGRRALLLAGTFHLFKSRPGEHGGGVTGPIERRHPGSTLVVAPHTGFRERTCELEERFATWPTPSIALTRGTWLGELPATLLFGGQGSFIARDGRAVDPFEGVLVQELVDAYLYLGREESLTIAVPPIAIYRDERYFQELNRRHQLLFGAPIDEHAPHYFRYGIPRQELRPTRLGPPPESDPH